MAAHEPGSTNLTNNEAIEPSFIRVSMKRRDGRNQKPPCLHCPNLFLLGVMLVLEWSNISEARTMNIFSVDRAV